MKNTLKILPRDTKSLIELAKQQGWEHSKTTGGHHRLVSPTGNIVGMSGTPSDYRSVKNFRMQLKRAGLKPYIIPVTVKKEKQNVTTHEIPKETLVIMSQPPVDPPVKKRGGGGPSEARGRVKEVLVPLMRKLDKPEGVGADDVRPELMAAFPTMRPGGISSLLSYYVKMKLLVKLSYSRYRLAELAGRAEVSVNLPAVPISTAAAAAPTLGDTEIEEDIRKLDEALAALVQIDSIVRKHREVVKQMAALRSLLGAIK